MKSLFANENNGSYGTKGKTYTISLRLQVQATSGRSGWLPDQVRDRASAVNLFTHLVLGEACIGCPVKFSQVTDCGRPQQRIRPQKMWI